MRTESELDRMHEDIVARFPIGLTPCQFVQVTLESADEDGRVYPHSITDCFARHSLLTRMWLDGLIENRGGAHNKPFEWYITEKGRARQAADCPPAPAKRFDDGIEEKTT
jgi:hypothetical protein